VPEKLGQGRIHDGEYASTADYGLTGAFQLIGPNGIDLRILSSGSDDGTGWEHVSVSCQHRTPNWQEMCFVKDLFWRESECVVQFHPPRSEYVNHHSYCLHLWKRVGAEIATPPSILVGPKEDNC
jgi:hypothetical protein